MGGMEWMGKWDGQGGQGGLVGQDQKPAPGDRPPIPPIASSSLPVVPSDLHPHLVPPIQLQVHRPDRMRPGEG